MRALFIAPLSAVLLTGCLTTQENPNYEHSTVYKGDGAAAQQHANSTPVAATSSPASYQSVPSTYSTGTSYSSPTTYSAPSTYSAPVSYESATSSYSAPTTYESAPIYAHPAPASPTFVPPASPQVAAATSYSASSYSSASTYTPPTDSAYSAQEVTGTPGFMALQAGQAPSTFAEVAPALPAAQVITHSPVAAAGTPISYDYSRNLISADVNTTGQYIPDTTRVLQGSGLQAPSGNYTVQPGDTVYSLARKTCVGVNVIQSMNGIGADYGIKIGQSLNLPASVC